MKRLAHTLLRLAAALPASLGLLHYHATRVVVGRQVAFESTCEWLALWPGASGRLVRSVFLGFTAERCDPTATIGVGVLLSKPAVRIGKHVYIGPRCHLGLATIEDDVLLAPGVQVTSGQHSHSFDRLDTPIRNQPGENHRVTIGRGAWIGAGAIIMADVGADAVVGAGSVVTRPVPPRVVAAGVPARVIRRREESPADPVGAAASRPPLTAHT